LIVAFDENIPLPLARALKELDGEDKLLRVEIVSARDYANPPASSDVPWLEQFARAGGQVIISGDCRMRSKLHERDALSKAGFIVFFFENRWNEANGFVKSAMLLRWWPFILERMRSAKPGQFFEIPFSYSGTELREVTPPNRSDLRHD